MSPARIKIKVKTHDTLVVKERKMTLELKKLLLGKLLHGEENFEKRINGGDRRKIRTYLADDKRTGLADRRMNISDLIKQIQDKYKKIELSEAVTKTK